VTDFAQLGATRFEYRGDYNVCARYHVYARQRLISYRQTTGLPQFRRRETLSNGVDIDILWNNSLASITITAPPITQPVIEIEQPTVAIFLESAYVDLNPFLPVDNNPFPGYVYYSPDLEGRVIVGDNEYSYLDEAALDLGADPERGYTAGMDSLAFKAESPKRTQWYSYFLGGNYATGTLKRLIQSHYGNEDPEPDADDRDITHQMTFARYSLLEFFSLTNHGIYKTSSTTPEYWLIEVKSEQVVAQKILLPELFDENDEDVYQTLYNRILDADNDDRVMIQAYLLALSAFDVEVPTLTAEIDPVEGDPVYYGWKFNYLGNKATITTRESIPRDPPNENKAKYITGRRYELDVSITGPDENGEYTLTASTSKKEEANCTPVQGQDLVWVPNLLNTSMEAIPWHDGSGFESDLLGVEAPVYSYYTKNDDGYDDDDLVVIYHKRESHSDGDTVQDLFDLQVAWANDNKLCPPGSFSGSFRAILNGELGGYYAKRNGSMFYDARVKRGGTALSNIVDIASATVVGAVVEDGLNPPNPEMPDNCGDTTSIAGHKAIWSQTKHRVEASSTTFATITGDSLFLIPWASTESCYLAKLDGTGGTSSVTAGERTVYAITESLENGAIQRARLSIVGFSGGKVGAGAPGTVTFDDGYPFTAAYQRYDLEVKLISKFHDVTAHTLAVDSDSVSGVDQETAEQDAAGQLQDWEALFNPVHFTEERFFSPRFFVQESAGFGEMIYTADITQDNAADRTKSTDDFYPDDVVPLQGVFVGGV